MACSVVIKSANKFADYRCHYRNRVGYRYQLVKAEHRANYYSISEVAGHGFQPGVWRWHPAARQLVLSKVFFTWFMVDALGAYTPYALL